MAKHHEICAALRKKVDSKKLDESFSYKEILQTAREELSKNIYDPTLSCMRKLCDSNHPDFYEFVEQGRSYEDWENVKTNWRFRLRDSCSDTFTDQQAKDFVTEVFDRVIQAKSTDDLDCIVKSKSVLYSNRMREEKYPKIHFRLNQEEIATLKQKGHLEENGSFSPDISQDTDLSPLEKLLYSIVWKNADIGKERHIVAGVAAGADRRPEEVPQEGVVFFGFGQYLADRQFPVIDQHVIRSFLVSEENDLKTIGGFRRKDTLSKKDWDAVVRYREWLGGSLDESLRQEADYRYHVDKVLFALGRAIKTYSSNRG